MLKLLHPSGEPTFEELEEYMAFAIEGRRRVKEQLNKRKPDDEYANINMAYLDLQGKEVVVWCPESRNADATQNPLRKRLAGIPDERTYARKKEPKELAESVTKPNVEIDVDASNTGLVTHEPKEQHYTIFYGEKGYSYERIFSDYLKGAKSIVVEDSYVRMQHQIQNFTRFCEVALKIGDVREIKLITGFDNPYQKDEITAKLKPLQTSIAEHGVKFEFEFSETLHDREITLSNGWIIKIGRGLDFYQKPENWYSVGASDLDLRPCLETKVDIFRRTL